MELVGEKSSVSRGLGWQAEWASAYRTAQDLVAAGLCGAQEAAKLEPVMARYRFVLPRYYASLIDREDPRCPIRRQAIPSIDELASDQRLVADPLADLAHQPAPRITHRYRSRALLHLTPACSMYCRYCFRKGLLNDLSPEMFPGGLEPALRYLETSREIEEVILSGGDPLLVSDATLSSVLTRLAKIPHLVRLRIHTRVPITFPARVDAGLSKVLADFPKQLVIVLHCNHPREVTPEVDAAVAVLKQSACAVLNQSVLLRGVNDCAATLRHLSESLFAIGVLPYYLHHPDRAAGTGHFDLPFAEGLRIHRELAASISGYLVPRYVVDRVGEPAKSPVADFAP